MPRWERLSPEKRIQRTEFQKLHEEQLFDDSVTKYWRNYDHAPDESIPEQYLLDSVVVQLTDSYQRWIDLISQNSRTPPWVHPMFAVGAAKMADITIRSIILSLFNSHFWRDREWQTMPGIMAQSAARAIADMTIDIIQYRETKATHRQDWLNVSHYQKNWTTKRCRSFTNKFQDIATTGYTRKQREDFGHHMLRIAESSGILTIVTKAESRNGRSWRNKTRVYLSDMVCAKLATHHQDLISTCAMLYRPMIVPPVPHTLEISGGHLNPWFRKPMVQNWDDDGWELRHGDSHSGSVPSPMVIDGLNSLMHTEWSINCKVMEVMANLFKGNTKLANLPAYSFDGFDFQSPYPVKGTKQEQAIWCVSREEAWSCWFKDEQKRQRMLIRLSLAKQLNQMDFFYHVYTCDFRGRSYSVCDLLSPQGGDFDRSLVMFSNAEKQTPQGLYWLKVHVANLFDQDKLTFDERVSWVDQNMTLFEAINEDPYDTKNLWISDKEKKNPSFQRLAAIFDLCREDGMTSIPVQMDGVCNGSQHWAAMMRDEELAKHVNVLPTEIPNDLYQVVADKATALCLDGNSPWHAKFLDHWDGKIDRAVTKRSAMCDSYGLTFYGIRKYMRSEGHVSNSWVPKEDMAAAVMELSMIVDQALKDILVQANVGKQYLKDIADIASECGRHLEWVTPCGFRVKHRYFPSISRRSVSKLFDMKELYFAERDYDSVDSRSANLAVPPNFIHSLDASHMWQTINKMRIAGIESYSMIHDSYGCPAPSVPLMRRIIKEEFFGVHEQPALDKFRTDTSELLGLPLPKYPETGGLDLRCVLESDYLFG